MAQEELFSQLSLWKVILCLKTYTFCLYFIYPIFTCVDPDQYGKYGSGSTTLLNTDCLSKVGTFNFQVRYKWHEMFCGEILL